MSQAVADRLTFVGRSTPMEPLAPLRAIRRVRLVEPAEKEAKMQFELPYNAELLDAPFAVPPGYCDGCIGCNTPEVEYIDDEDDDEVVVTAVSELPPDWVSYLKDDRGFDDHEIIEHAQTWYGYGCWPTRCLPLDAATILNGRLLKQHYIGSFFDYPAVEEFPHYFEGDGDEGANRVADCMNWCRKNCEGNWVISTREHVQQLWYVFVSFDDADDEAAYLRDHR